MNRTRYGCRNIDRDHQRNVAPVMQLTCPRCDDYIRSLVAGLVRFADDEYVRGFCEGARAHAAHADRVLKGKGE